MSDHSKKIGHGYRDLLKSIDHFFHQTSSFVHPIPIRISEEKDVWVIEAELPGIEKEQLRLDIYQQAIRIQVNQSEQLEYKDDKEGLIEQQKQSYTRQRIVPLPFLVNEKHVRATYKNGLLQIIIPIHQKPITIE